jgi:branched-chain amino acid transport system substrate-binding protein
VRNYFRVATPDDVQGPANGQYAYNDLGKRKAFVVDDTEAFGVGVANTFSEEFEKLGGTIVGRQGNDYTQNQDFSSMLNAVAGQFDVVFFGGTQVTGGGQLRKQMGQAGLLDIPFVGPDGTTDLGAGGATGTFITLAGVENSGNVYGTVAGIHDIPDPEAFATKYKGMFQNADPGAYSALAYACAQVLLQSLDAALKGGADASDIAALREAVRANVFSGATFETVLGPLHFDENGDTSQKWISFYKTDVSLNDGKGGWVFDKQQNFAEDAAPGESPAASTAP